MNVLREGDLVQRYIIANHQWANVTGIIIAFGCAGKSVYILWPGGKNEWVWKDDLVKIEKEDA